MARKTILIVVGILLLLGIISAVVYFVFVRQAVIPGAICSGGQVLSLDSARITYSNELQKDVVRVVFSTLETAECLEIDLSTSELQNELEGENFEVTNRILGDIAMTKKFKTYNIFEEQDKKFFRFGTHTFDAGGIFVFCTDNECKRRLSSSAANNLVASISWEGPDCVCVYDDEKGIAADFTSSSALEWEAKIKMGDEPILTLNQDDLSGKIADFAFVKWSGNLVSNDQLDSIDADAYKPYSTNQFRMVESGTYYNLKDKHTSIKSEIISCGQGTAPVTQCVQEYPELLGYNGQFDDKTQTNQVWEWRDREPLVSDADIYNNILSASLKSPIVYPTFTIDIDAEDVGIFISVGEPEVTCPPKFEMISGDSKSEILKIKNKGSYSGSFSYFVDCNKGSQILQPSPPKTIGAGQTLDITGTFGLIVEEGTETASCIFTATELNSLAKDSCSFSYDSTHQSQCIEGTKTCEEGNTELWECLAGGSYKKTICDFGCESFENTFRCRLQAKEICDDGIDNDGDGLIDDKDPDCQNGGVCGCWIRLPEILGGACILPDLWCHINNFINKFKLIFSIVLGFLGGLLSTSYIHRLTGKMKLKKSWWILLLTFLILGGALGYLAYLYFWWILLVIVIFGIIRAFIPGI